MEESTGKRINVERCEDAIKTKGMEEKLFARDIAELVVKSVEGK